ncbi:MAG TPA: nucleoside triphosphate pyrophosphatase [Thermodesulfovibrionales bacterium]|jgi:septum formation protein|nr:nucleoside triphosphate pyrophosphatase [Thermodesulfovibrionales bacterium]
MKPIILASASPRRRELLALTGLKFKVDPGDYEEAMDSHRAPHDLARFLSLEKARAVAPRHRDAIIIAADTFIVFNGELLGKPRTGGEARRMLRMLSGKSHSVITGFTVLDTGRGRRLSRSVQTRVWFRRLAPGEIDAYVRSGEPLDKAGGYAIQGLGSLIVRKIEGDFFNVIGLPLSALVESLKRFGINVL